MRKIHMILLALIASTTPLFAEIEGALTGRFTINENGDQIVFSKGNLQYQASTNTWRFAEHQYDMVGEKNAYISQKNKRWIDLFGWGTGMNPALSSGDFKDYESPAEWGANAISNRW